MKAADRTEFFRRLRELNPQPKTELLYDSVFELLIAVLLSAQATDVSVNKATRLLFAAANTPQTMFNLGVDGVKKWIKPPMKILKLLSISMKIFMPLSLMPSAKIPLYF